MKLLIKRSVPDEVITYEIDAEGLTLLAYLNLIKSKQDASLTYSHSCRSGVCGSCAVRVNGKEKLMCTYKPASGDLIEPLGNTEVLRDLVVNYNHLETCNTKAQGWIETINSSNVSEEEMEKIALQSDCILCSSCHSACPVFAVNPNFIGPFALTRAWRYANDPRNQDATHILDAVQKDGIWDCTLCGECVPVCPQNIAPKQDITMLRMKSAMAGYQDPNAASMFGGGLDFGGPVF